MSKKKSAAEEAVMEPNFTKEALVNSKRFRDKRDIASALLKDDVKYTVSEVEAMITEYMKGKVK